MIRAIYNSLLYGGMALASPWLGLRMLRGRYRNIARARLGMGRDWLPPAGAKGAIWLHALSVGEVGSALPLLRELARRHPERPAALSVSTAQGLLVAQKELQGDPGIFLFTRPLDLPGPVGRMLDHLQPSLFCLVEGDIWPNWQWKLAERGVPRILVNGRVSPRTYKGYKRLGGLARELFAGFDRVLVQTGVDQERLLDIGVEPARLALGGNLKFDSAPEELGPDEKESLALELGLSGRRVLVAGSTHPSEEEPCLDAMAALRDKYPGLALVIAPREISRGGAVARLAAERGLSAARASRGENGQGVQVLVLDVLGKLARSYALAQAAFVGGSLMKQGGHNLLEPASQGVPVLYGPITHNFLHMAKELVRAGGGIRVADGQELVAKWAALLADDDLRQATGRAAQEFCRAHQGAVKRAADEVSALLEGRHA